MGEKSKQIPTSKNENGSIGKGVILQGAGQDQMLLTITHHHTCRPLCIVQDGKWQNSNIKYFLIDYEKHHKYKVISSLNAYICHLTLYGESGVISETTQVPTS